MTPRKMEKIVVIYTDSDGCTYSNEIVVAIETESAEDFYVNFEAWVQKCIDDRLEIYSYPIGTYKVGTYKFEVSDFCALIPKPSHDKSKGHNWVIEMPEVYTLAEWFEKKKVI
jgi:hypothetical protein